MEQITHLESPWFSHGCLQAVPRDTGHRAVSVMSREHLLSTLPGFPLCPQGAHFQCWWAGFMGEEIQTYCCFLFLSSVAQIGSGITAFYSPRDSGSIFLLDVLLHSSLCLWSELMCLYSLSYVLLSLYVKMADGCHGDAEVGPNLLIKANKHPTFRLYLPWVLTSLIDLNLPEASPYIDVTACGERLIISWGVTYFCILSMEITPICHI